MQTVPKPHKIDQIKADLAKIVPGEDSISEIHIWKLSAGNVIVTAHITCESLEHFMNTERKVKEYFRRKKIHYVTIHPRFSKQVSMASLVVVFSS